MSRRELAISRIGTVERVLHLKRLPTLGTLPAAELALLADHARERHFSRGDCLLREAEPVPAIHFVVDGTVQVTRRGVPIGSGGPGSALGGLGLLARDREGLGATARSDVLTLELEADSLLEVFEDHFSILHHILRETCGQLIDLQARSLVPMNAQSSRLVPITTSSRDLDLVERIFILRQAPPFRRTSINALAGLSRGLTQVRFNPGTTLWRDGDPASWLLLIISGSVTCTQGVSGTTFERGPGAPLGILEGLAGRRRWFDTTTQTEVTALQGQLEGLIDVFEDNFEMAMGYLAVMCRWLQSGIEIDSGYRPSTIGVLTGEVDPSELAARTGSVLD